MKTQMLKKIVVKMNMRNNNRTNLKKMAVKCKLRKIHKLCKIHIKKENNNKNLLKLTICAKHSKANNIKIPNLNLCLVKNIKIVSKNLFA